jgi:hypothetical protein
MAKSFKKGPTTESTLPKPTSEWDFFDFLEGPTAELSIEAAGSGQVASLPAAAELLPGSNTGKQGITGRTPVTQEPAGSLQKPAPDAEPPREKASKPVASLSRHRPVPEQPDLSIAEPVEVAASPVAPPPAAITTSAPSLPTAESNQGVRQTFVVGAQCLEELRNFVHAKRAAGAYWYSQRQAIEEGLALLFATHGPLSQRPDHIQIQEQERRARIQKGRRAGRTPKDLS